jgi:predicted metal-dependent hydrolase
MERLNFVLYRGVEYDVKLLSYAGRNTQVFFREGSFTVYINKNLNENEKCMEAARHLEQWLRENSSEIIEERVMEYSRIIGVSYNNIRIKDTKSRWGSCSSKGNLNFSWRIIMAPPETMDYVIIHELCHLIHMNHSKEFWTAVEKHMPDYSKQKEWLRKNGMKLHA